MNDSIAQFRARLNEDPVVRQRLLAGEDMEDLTKELGYNVTWEALVAEARATGSVELSDYELELIAGGANKSKEPVTAKRFFTEFFTAFAAAKGNSLYLDIS